MEKIKVYVDYKERSKVHYWAMFEVVDRLPKVGEVVYGDDDDALRPYYGERERVERIWKVEPDCEQGNDDVFEYDYFEVFTRLEEYDKVLNDYFVTDEFYCAYRYAIRK